METKNFKVELSLEEVNLVITGLSNLPLGKVLEVYNKIKTQVQEQINKVNNEQQQ